MNELLALVVILVIARWFFRSPLCGASADALRRRTGGRESSDEELLQSVEQLTEQIGALRSDVLDLAERVDFTERALSEVRRTASALPGREL